MKKIIFDNSNVISSENVTERNFIGIEFRSRTCNNIVARKFFLKLAPDRYILAGTNNNVRHNEWDSLNTYNSLPCFLEEMRDWPNVTMYVFDTRQELYRWMAEA